MIRNEPTTPGAMDRGIGVLLVVGLLGWGSTARADDVWAGRLGRNPLKYGSVRIRGDEAGQLVFRGRAGNMVSKPIEQIARIRVQGEPELNEAEELFAKGQYVDAVGRYERVLGKTPLNWLKRYVTARLVTCYDADGRLVDAVNAWVETLGVWPSYGIVRPPKNLAAKGSKLNTQALAAITAALGEDLTPEAAEALEQLRVAIWRIEGDPRAEAAEKARASRSDKSGEPVGAERPPRPGRSTNLATGSGGFDVAEALARAGRLAENGRHDDALARINQAISSTPERRRKSYLPRLLTLKAKCLLAKGGALAEAGKADQARRQLIYGALAAMHVVTSFQESPSFIECLYLVARCHEGIGRPKQAVALYRECREFAIGRGQGKWQRKATEALKRLDVKLK